MPPPPPFLSLAQDQSVSQPPCPSTEEADIYGRYKSRTEVLLHKFRKWSARVGNHIFRIFVVSSRIVSIGSSSPSRGVGITRRRWRWFTRVSTANTCTYSTDDDSSRTVCGFHINSPNFIHLPLTFFDSFFDILRPSSVVVYYAIFLPTNCQFQVHTLFSVTSGPRATTRVWNGCHAMDNLVLKLSFIWPQIKQEQFIRDAAAADSDHGHATTTRMTMTNVTKG